MQAGENAFPVRRWAIARSEQCRQEWSPGSEFGLKVRALTAATCICELKVEPHPYFTLQEGDVYCRLPITPSEAALGGTIRSAYIGRIGQYDSCRPGSTVLAKG